MTKISRELRCKLRQQLFVGYYGASVQPQLLARQCQVQRNPSSEVDGAGPATEKSSSHLPSNLHHAQRLCRFTNGEIQPRGRPFPSHTTSLRYSDSDYEVIHMPDLAYQTPPSYHQCTSGGCRTSQGCARRPVRPVNYQNRRTVIETGSSNNEYFRLFFFF